MSSKEESNIGLKAENTTFSKTESHMKKDLNKIIRKSYRISLTKWSTIKFKVNNSTFDVVNISANGLAIRIDNPDLFSVGQELPDVKLNLEGTYLIFRGKVNHISPDSYGHYLCGIDIINVDESNKEVLQKFVQQNRNELFG